MPPLTISTAQLAVLERTVRNLVRACPAARLRLGRRGVPDLAAALARGRPRARTPVTLLLLAPAAIVLFFARGVLELVSGVRPAAADAARGTGAAVRAGRARRRSPRARPRNAPILLWRLRRSVGSLRDVAGIALPFRVLTPGFLTTAFAAFACLVLWDSG